MRRLSYLFPAFPVLHQTFTLGEVLGLKRRGYDLVLISLKRSEADLQQPEARPLLDETHYCPRLFSVGVVGAFGRGLVARPRDVFGLFGCVIRAWRTRAPFSAENDAPPPATLSFAERVLAVYHHNAWVYLAKSLVLVPYAVYLAEYLQRENVAHVHAHWATYPTTVAYLIKRWAGIPYSFTAHAYDIYMISRMLPEKIRQAAFVVTCADTNRRYLCSLVDARSSERVFVNYHGTDLGRFAPVRRARAARFRIMSCGWLKEYKGFHILLEALALLVQRGIDAVLDIAGDGPQRAFLEARATELGIRDRLRLHGYLPHASLVELYRSCDVFAMPSIVMGNYGRQDVIPNVLAEAMAVGTPVLATAIAGIPELIDDEQSGLLVPERDPRALADALERLWKDEALAARLAAAGRAKVERIWNRERNLEELAALINAHVSQPASGLAA
jgi:glycosyltransferase involved in cell wall biosynthesis